MRLVRHGGGRAVAVITAVVCVCSSALLTAQAGSASQAPSVSWHALSSAPAPASAPPNVVLVTTDDMRVDDLAVMPRTRRLLGQLELTDFISNHPVCCPARAELLTGQFGHHNGVFHNPTSPWGGYERLLAKRNTLPWWLARAGYRAGLVGKFLNGWDHPEDPRPRGWSDFVAFARNAFSAYGYSYLDRAGTLQRAPQGLHTNDFVTGTTQRLVKRYAAGDAPFFVWASYVAPHVMHAGKPKAFGPPTPAARHVGDLAGVVPTSMAKPSFEDPPPRVTARALSADAARSPSRAQIEVAEDTDVTELNQARLESLLSVDEGVARIVRTLARTGQLEDTVVVFTSDNGFLLGEHGLVGKNSWFEESLRVPLLARGPGVDAGASGKPAMFVDLAPSIAALAGAPAMRQVDGRADLFAPSAGWDGPGGTLIQAGSDVRPWQWRGVRTDRWTYLQRFDEQGLVVRRLYDRRADPYQLDDLAGTPQAEQVEAELSPYLLPLDEGASTARR